MCDLFDSITVYGHKLFAENKMKQNFKRVTNTYIIIPVYFSKELTNVKNVVRNGLFCRGTEPMLMEMATDIECGKAVRQ